MFTRHRSRSGVSLSLARTVALLAALATLALFTTAVSADTTTPTQTGTGTTTGTATGTTTGAAAAQTAQATTTVITGYCFNAPIIVTSDGAGNTAYTCTVTGQRIYPATNAYGSYPYSGYGYGNAPYYGYAGGVVPGWVPPGTYNGITCGGLYGCPLDQPAYPATYVTGNIYCGLYTCGVPQPITR
jgi:hypothetical protein